MQKVFDKLIGLAFEEFYKNTINLHRERKPTAIVGVGTDHGDQGRTSPKPNVDVVDEDDNESNDKNERETVSNCSTSPHQAKPQEDSRPMLTLEDIVNSKLLEMREYIILNEEKQLKTKKLDASTAKLDLKKEHYNLITSIRLDSCRDLISRYNRLISKK